MATSKAVAAVDSEGNELPSAWISTVYDIPPSACALVVEPDGDLQLGLDYGQVPKRSQQPSEQQPPGEGQTGRTRSSQAALQLAQAQAAAYRQNVLRPARRVFALVLSIDFLYFLADLLYIVLTRFVGVNAVDTPEMDSHDRRLVRPWISFTDARMEELVFCLVIDFIGAISATQYRTVIITLFVALLMLSTLLISLQGASLFLVWRFLLLTAAVRLRSVMFQNQVLDSQEQEAREADMGHMTIQQGVGILQGFFSILLGLDRGRDRESRQQSRQQRQVDRAQDARQTGTSRPADVEAQRQRQQNAQQVVQMEAMGPAYAAATAAARARAQAPQAAPWWLPPPGVSTSSATPQPGGLLANVGPQPNGLTPGSSSSSALPGASAFSHGMRPAEPPPASASQIRWPTSQPTTSFVNPIASSNVPSSASGSQAASLSCEQRLRERPQQLGASAGMPHANSSDVLQHSSDAGSCNDGAGRAGSSRTSSSVHAGGNSIRSQASPGPGFSVLLNGSGPDPTAGTTPGQQHTSSNSAEPHLPSAAPRGPVAAPSPAVLEPSKASASGAESGPGSSQQRGSSQQHQEHGRSSAAQVAGRKLSQRQDPGGMGTADGSTAAEHNAVVLGVLTQATALADGILGVQGPKKPL